MTIPSTNDQWDAASGDNDLYNNASSKATGTTSVAKSSGGYYTVSEYWGTLGTDGQSTLSTAYTALSKALFGESGHTMTAGYLYDEDYKSSVGAAHSGFDIDSNDAEDEPVYVLVPGTVKYVKTGTSSGVDCVIVEGIDGNLWVYGHVTAASGISVGSTVSEGQKIGIADDYSGGNHVHLEVQPGTYSSSEMSDGYLWGNYATSTTVASDATIKQETMSPLQAYYNYTASKTPTVSLKGPSSITEGSSGTSYATYTVSLSSAATSTVKVVYGTSNGTASSGSDYGSTSGTLTIAAGSSSGTIKVPVYGDTTSESSETFSLSLSSASNATVGSTKSVTTTITTDDYSTKSYMSLATDDMTARFGAAMQKLASNEAYRASDLTSSDSPELDVKKVLYTSNVIPWGLSS